MNAADTSPRRHWFGSAITTAAGWLALERAVQIAVTLSVGFWVARHLGPESFGTLGYALAIPAMLAPLTAMGLQGLMLQHFVNAHEEESELLGTSTLVRLLGGLTALLLVLVVLAFLDPVAPEARGFIILLSIGSLFQSVHVIEFWLQARSAFGSATAARIGAIVFASGLRVGAILAGAGVAAFAWIAASESALVAAALFVVYRRQRTRPARWRYSPALARRLLRDSAILVLSGFTAAIYLRIDQVMLGQMNGAASVGIYTAATRITEATFLLPAFLMTAAFPTMLRIRLSDSDEYRDFLQAGFDLLATATIVMAAVATLAAEPLIRVLYGDAFQDASTVLVIHIWAAVFVTMRALVSKWLIAEGLLGFSLLSHGAGAIVNVAANLYLIPRYGAPGAAWGTLISCVVASYLIFFFHAKTRDVALMMTLGPFAVFRRLRRYWGARRA